MKKLTAILLSVVVASAVLSGCSLFTTGGVTSGTTSETTDGTTAAVVAKGGSATVTVNNDLGAGAVGGFSFTY
jgi:hypothetical protein